MWCFGLPEGDGEGEDETGSGGFERPRGLYMRTMMRPKMIKTSSRMQRRRPVFLWYLGMVNIGP